jgi:hypothetical protein
MLVFRSHKEGMSIWTAQLLATLQVGACFGEVPALYSPLPPPAPSMRVTEVLTLLLQLR